MGVDGTGPCLYGVRECDVYYNSRILGYFIISRLEDVVSNRQIRREET